MKRSAVCLSGILGTIVVISMFCLASPAFADLVWNWTATSWENGYGGDSMTITSSNDGQTLRLSNLGGGFAAFEGVSLTRVDLMGWFSYYNNLDYTFPFFEMYDTSGQSADQWGEGFSVRASLMVDGWTTFPGGSQIQGNGSVAAGENPPTVDSTLILNALGDIPDLVSLSYNTTDNAESLFDLYTNQTETPSNVDNILWHYVDGTLEGDTGGTLYSIGDSWTTGGKYYIKLGSGLEGEPLGGGVPEPSSMAVIGLAVAGLFGKRFRKVLR